MLTPDDITAATADPAAVDLPMLERAFLAFVAYPAGEGLSGFADHDHMLAAFVDGACVHLIGDFNPVPDATHEALLDYARTHYGLLLGFSYRDGAVMAIQSWRGFRERFAAVVPG